MMPAPSVFAERFAALEQVLAARRRRSQALVALASGRVTVEQVLESEDPAIGLTMVAAVLQTLRGIGAATAAVRQWRYEPSDVGPTSVTISVRFVLVKERVRATRWPVPTSAPEPRSGAPAPT